jgi:superfamily II DNA/RNA helicase
VAAINGDINQQQRERTIQQLKDGKIDILVATDVARVVWTLNVSATSSTTTCRMIRKAIRTVSAVLVVRVAAVKRFVHHTA